MRYLSRIYKIHLTQLWKEARSDMPLLQMSHEAKDQNFLLLFSPRGGVV